MSFPLKPFIDVPCDRSQKREFLEFYFVFKDTNLIMFAIGNENIHVSNISRMDTCRAKATAI